MLLSNPVPATIKMDAPKCYVSALDLRHFWKPPALRFVTHSKTQHFGIAADF